MENMVKEALFLTILTYTVITLVVGTYEFVKVVIVNKKLEKEKANFRIIFINLMQGCLIKVLLKTILALCLMMIANLVALLVLKDNYFAIILYFCTGSIVAFLNIFYWKKEKIKYNI